MYLKASSSSACSSEERARADELLEAVMRAVPENFSTVADVMRETAALWDGECGLIHFTSPKLSRCRAFLVRALASRILRPAIVPSERYS